MIKDNNFWNGLGLILCVIMIVYLLMVAVLYEEFWWVITLKILAIPLFLFMCYIIGEIYYERGLKGAENE